MGRDIDLYRFEATAVRKPEDELVNWLLTRPEKWAYLVDVDEDCPSEIREGLARLGVEPGDSVIVIIQ